MPDLQVLGPLFDRARAGLRRAGVGTVVVVAATVGALAAAGLLWGHQRVAAAPAPAVEALPRAVRVTTTTTPPAPLVVHVAGAVVRPGLVTVPDGARVADAVVAAGGFRPDADPVGLNLAERLVDGSRLHVAAAGEADAPAVLVTGGSTGVTTGSRAGPLDLNTATVEQLEDLPGVGPATASAIVAHRERNGRFGTVDALADVRGIGPAKLEALRDLVRV